MTDTVFILDRNKNVIDYLSNNGVSPDAPFFDDVYIQELSNGVETYEFSTLSNTRTSEALELGNYVVFKYDNNYKMFQIMDLEDDHKDGKQIINCYCEMAGLELLTDYCEPFSIEGNVELFFNTVLQDTNWSLGGYSSSLATNIQQVKVDKYTNVYKVIQENISTYGNIEIEYRVEFDGNRLLGYFIDVYENGHRGSKVYKRFEYGENVSGITRKRNLNDFASAMIGQGKDKLTFKDIEWKKSNGDPADKPKGQDFVVDLEANDKFNKHGKYIKGLFDDSDITNPQDLLLKSWEKLQEVKEPKFDYDVDLALTSVEYEDIKIGDTNYVIDNDYNPPIFLESRIGKLEISLTDPNKNKCTLSNYKEVVSKIREPKDGENGKTPEIGNNGNWWVGGFDTGKPAQGGQGLPGKDGEPAKYVRVAGEQVFKYTSGFAGTPTPSVITIASSVIGVTNPSRVWSYKTPSMSNYVNMSSTDANIVIMHNDVIWGGSKSITVRCSVGDKYDEITLVKVSDGVNGTDGLNGADGINGKDGVSLIYKGEFAAHPSSPQDGWYYRNTTDKKCYVYQKAWYQMTIDGKDGLNGNNGKDGLSIEYKGIMANPPSNPQKNWTYKDSDNGIVYIYTGIAWEVLTYDGDNGQDGADGQNGLSIFVTYNDSVTQPAIPTGNGTTNGWHTNSTVSSVWISQKVASSATTGTWGTPIKIKGESGIQGDSGYTIVLSNENHAFPCQFNGNIPNAITTKTKVIALKGTKEITPTIGTLPTIPGLTLTKSGATITVVANVGTGLADYGSFDIPITVDGIGFTKTFTWSKSKAGANGTNGTNGSNGISPLNATLSGQSLMKYLDKTTAPTPATIAIKCKAMKGATEVTGACSYQWQAYYSDKWNNIGTGSSMNIAYNSSYFLNLDILQIRVNVTYGNETITLEHTISKVYDNKYITQQEIFNKLTENGNDFLYTDPNTGKIYINITYAKAGQLVADLIKGGILTLGGTGDNTISDYGVLRILDFDGVNELARIDGGEAWFQSLSATEMNVEKLSVNNIEASGITQQVTSTISISINSSTGNDESEFIDEAIFATLQGALDACPRNLGGRTVNITLETDTQEDIYWECYYSGRIRIYWNGKTIYGYMRGYMNSNVMQFFGGTLSDSSSKTGKIMPNKGYNHAGMSASVSLAGCGNCFMQGIDIYSATNLADGCKEDAALCCGDGGYIYIRDVTPINCTYGFRANANAVVYSDSTGGKASKYGFTALSGGQVRLSNGKHTGGSSGNTYESSGGEVKYHNATFEGTSTSGSNTSKPNPTTYKATYTSNYGDTYRSSKYNSWKKDNTVRQGDYGYGDCNGAWFFSTKFAELKGRTITKVTIKISRTTGGTSSSVTHTLKAHKESSRPGGMPRYIDGYSQTFGLAVGSSTTVTITNSTVLNAIKSGDCKGFGLQSSYDKSHYSVCKGSATVTIYYQ
ncbi:phage tail spike protein [Terrisporobacter petrolearius]|uniref:phage tail spike protein n=1 Tax=Terrisporobacter petrolearius TaxID=1460447 RepID=UPI0031CC7920